MQLAAGENVQQSMSVSSGVDSDVVSKLIVILEAQGIQVSNDQRTGIESAISEAKQGNAGTAKSLLFMNTCSLWCSHFNKKGTNQLRKVPF